MTIYLLLLLFVSICASRYDSSKNNAWLWVIFFALTLVAGLRDVEVGTDSYNYYFQFNNQATFAQLNIFRDLTHEVGFDILLGLSQKIGSNYASLFLLIAATVYSVAIVSIRKGSESMLISMFVYIALCLSSFCYNGARQGIAIAIYMFSLQYLIRDDFTKYCFIVLLAALFHKTIIIALPLYFLFRRRYNGLTICYIIVAISILTFFLPEMLTYASTLDDRYAGYLGKGNGGGVYLTLAYDIMAAFFVYARLYIQEYKKKIYDTYLLMFLCGALIFNIVVLGGLYIEISRFSAYFVISAVFLWPMIFKSNLRGGGVLIKACFFLGHIAFMYIFYSRMAALTPYIFNKSLFIY